LKGGVGVWTGILNDFIRTRNRRVVRIECDDYNKVCREAAGRIREEEDIIIVVSSSIIRERFHKDNDN
jgi:hypothetical protein